jgi:hypothetical protein
MFVKNFDLKENTELNFLKHHFNKCIAKRVYMGVQCGLF